MVLSMWKFKKNPDSIRVELYPLSKHNFQHTVVLTAPVKRSVVLWNLLDYSHVNWVHRKVYRYCKILAESGNTCLLEYGVNQLFFLPWKMSFPTIMYREFIPPDRVRHLSRSPWGAYTKVEVKLEEFTEKDRVFTKMINIYSSSIPRFLLPFKKFMTSYIDNWVRNLWSEDLPMLLRRQQVLDLGFRDHPADVAPKSPEGLAVQ